MIADLLPVMALSSFALLLSIVALVALKVRGSYCGKDPKNCFWCGKDCEFYRLNKVRMDR